MTGASAQGRTAKRRPPPAAVASAAESVQNVKLTLPKELGFLLELHPYKVAYGGRHGLKTTIDAIDPGAVSGRARGRALLDYTHGKGADLLVMGAYGRGQVMSFLGLGGATGKVISSCRVPLLLAH